ncbi:MAG: hypothetical protein M1820_003710 [Bogoriella megaspora]|nr:MAG: hypothetical protein M1820_003710 [Bogoriella megaspora]
MGSTGNSTNTDVVHAAEQLLAAAKAYDNGDVAAKMGLLNQVGKFRFLVEGPMEVIMRQWDATHVTAALKLLISTGALQAIPINGSTTAKELADKVGLDESAISMSHKSRSVKVISALKARTVRPLRIICIQGIVDEPEPDVYAANDKTRSFLEGPIHFFWKVLLDQEHAYSQLPRYFKTHTKEDLFDLKKSPYAFAKDREGMTYYQVISDDPERFEMFNNSLVHMDAQMPVLGMFPFASLKAQVEADPSRAFIVDIGGGHGRVLRSVLEEAPAGFGAQSILQDRADVLASIPDADLPHITKMEHDFFTPQPVRGAHVYLFRRILHDFYEPVCIELVKNVASAMNENSRLLIGDFVVPEKTNVGDDMMIYWMDFCMMMITGKEKTKKQFEEILDAAGCELVKIWPHPISPQAIVEARLKRK